MKAKSVKKRTRQPKITIWAQCGACGKLTEHFSYPKSLKAMHAHQRRCPVITAK
jgi:hypothetical protein